MNTKACRICGNAEANKTYIAKEMMFGLKDEFEYLECANCKCLQLMSIPADLSKYYPENYYSYFSKGEQHHIQTSVSKTIKRQIKKVLLDSFLKGDNMIGRLISPKLGGYYPWIKKATLTSRSRILDVGCGSGELLLKMSNDGFKDLTGLDPFIKEDIHYKSGITIHKKTLDQLNEPFDLIMMHHAFEHMDHPLSIIQQIHSLLRPGGLALIRIPVGDSYAWKKYGVDWVQLDAPRHLFLHTTKSMQILCQQSGFTLDDVIYDSWSLQFYGSELYKKGIPLRADKEKEIFTPQQMDAFQHQARELNEKKEGDSACFYLKKS
jgi:2-polyprenyl-3-methyl-5-hydroxy-6-metoxy-1,4-benzoquinol methylase